MNRERLLFLITGIAAGLMLMRFVSGCNESEPELRYIQGEPVIREVPGKPDTVKTMIPYPVYVTMLPDSGGEKSSFYDSVFVFPEGKITVKAETFPKTDSLRLDILTELPRLTITRVDSFFYTRVDTLKELIREEIPFYENEWLWVSAAQAIAIIFILLAAL